MQLNRRIRRAVLLGWVLALGALLPTAAHAGGDWNDKGIAWKPYEAGLAEAKSSKKPVLLIFYTEWCPHCTNYSKNFHDAKVVEQAKKFVMIRVDNDKDKELSGKFAPDGKYIPRTFFLTSTGVLDPDLHAQRDQYKYFYDESNPASVLAAMDAALAKLK